MAVSTVVGIGVGIVVSVLVGIAHVCKLLRARSQCNQVRSRFNYQFVAS
jgi:hypothetical protein